MKTSQDNPVSPQTKQRFSYLAILNAPTIKKRYLIQANLESGVHLNYLHHVHVRNY